VRRAPRPAARARSVGRPVAPARPRGVKAGRRAADAQVDGEATKEALVTSPDTSTTETFLARTPTSAATTYAEALAPRPVARATGRPCRAARHGAGIVSVAWLVLAAAGSGPAWAEERGAASGPAASASALPVPDPAPMCRVDPAAQVSTGAALAELRARLAAEAASADDVVVLNGRGYNYAEPAAPDPALLRFESRQQRP
jgi:hypothetical protein